ncbi:MAG: tRNA (N(6)-L-threonylcarbamoyladenosine(37)-C(2))-methylthiotransferase MtaB [Ferruginibacter sp.]|nr:tRNA (N(6)-L-threonylcarbamoyladenosine(37)-C(2))-methylthiotransferase MtaB [Ferruginibacter sp.]
MSKSVALYTLGCKLNFSETTAIGRMLEKDGFVQKSFEDNADIYIINTCAVTESAEKEARQIVRRIQRRSPGSMVVIIGCYAQLKPKEIAELPGVTLVLGATEKFNISYHLQTLHQNDSGRICSCDIEDVNVFIPSYSVHERTRVFLKVQDGCDYNCSFCTIPLARGKSRSNTIEKVVEDVRKLGADGTREVVLTGINLGDFGKGYEGGRKREEAFYDLIQALDDDGAVDRFRISSIEPNLLTSDIISFVAKSKHFMPHFHIPLQSGSNKTLAAMRRRYKRELYLEKVQEIKSIMPHACIGVDVIVGFPGETEDDFDETTAFIQSLNISYLHVFTYSERANTDALKISDVVPVGIRHDRNRILRNLSYHKMRDFTRMYSGQKRSVLFESQSKNGMMEGYSDNYIKVIAPYQEKWVNEIVDWEI